MHFPNHNCEGSACLLFVQSDNQINGTVVKFITSGMSDFYCKFAGLVFGEKSSNDYYVIDSMCTRFENLIYAYHGMIKPITEPNKFYQPSVYSSGRFMAVLFFWYENFLTFNVSLSISPTKCKARYFNFSAHPCRKHHCPSTIQTPEDFGCSGIVIYGRSRQFIINAIFNETDCINLIVLDRVDVWWWN